MLLPLAALVACTPKEDAPAALTATPAAVDLGTVAVGDSAETTVVLANSGGGAIEILSASLVDGDARAWTIARDGFDPLEDSVVTTLTITFAPDEEGASPAELQVRSTDEASPSLYVALDGIGGPSTADDDGDGYSAADGDCHDGDADIHPGAEEACNGVDDDCDGTTPADEADDDREGLRLCDGDCDDTDAAVYPGAAEICDDKDSDCDGVTPDRADADGDGYTICDADCDDADDVVFPGGVEVCDGVDNDCSGTADDLDADGDGATLCGSLPDCDDDDPAAFPVYVDPAAAAGGSGSEAAPFATIAEALVALDDTCRTVGLFSGTYAEATEWSRGELALVGLAGDPSGVAITPPAGERAFTVTGGALTLENLSFVAGSNTDGDGGAVYASNADLTLRRIVATLNTTAADGGAVAVASGTLTLEDGCVFSSNTAGDDGGAIALVSATLVDTGSAYIGNRAITGGGVFAVSTSVEIESSTFEGNTATGDGGGLALDSIERAYLDRLLFTENDAGGRGGGASLNDVDTDYGWARNMRFLGNTADEGGGAAMTGGYAALVFANNTFVGNQATGDGAAALIESDASANFYFWSNILAWNVGDSGLFVADGIAPGVYRNLGYATSSGVDFGLPDVYDETSENLVADPVFTSFTDNGDAYDDDLTLGPGSPAIDSGPADGTGPEGYWDWSDVDGTENDRGYTGGQGGW